MYIPCVYAGGRPSVSKDRRVQRLTVIPENDPHSSFRRVSNTHLVGWEVSWIRRKSPAGRETVVSY